MTTYFFVFIGIFIFFGIAQTQDYCEVNLDSGIVNHTPSSKRAFVIGVLILILVAGLRYRVGTDYLAYYRGFEGYSYDLFQRIKDFDEPGIRLISYIVHWFTNDAAVYIFVCAFVTLFLMLRTVFRYSTQLFMAGMLFVFLGCWHGAFNGIRQFLAAAIIFSAYPFLRNRQFWKWTLFVFIGFLFHKSAIIMIVPYFFAHRKIDWKNTLFIIIGCIIVFYSYDRLYGFVDAIMGEETNWSISYMSRSLNIFRVLVGVIPAIFYLYSFRNIEKSADDTFWLNLLIIQAVAMVISSQSAYIARIILYTTPFSAIAIPELNKKLDDRYRVAVSWIILILFFVYWWYDVGHSGNIDQFHWIWNR